MIQTINPATEEIEAVFEELSGAELDEKLESGYQTFVSYRNTDLRQRAHWLLEAARILDQQKEAFARLITREMGKPFMAAIAEVEKSALVCRYYADGGAEMVSPQKIYGGEGVEEGWIHYHPLGPVLAVMPWNFPFWQVFRFAAPALMAGNVAFLKHASNVPRCSLAIQKVFMDAGFPQGVFQSLLIPSRAVEGLIADRRVAAVTLTGSEGAGMAVAAAAGRALKKCVLELGGSDPFIVMADTDIRTAAEAAVNARVVNSGQSCIAAKRFLIQASVMAEFQEHFVNRINGLTVGDPLDPETRIGPLATEQILTDLDDQVNRTIVSGATLVTGGHRLERRGYFYAPTVFTDLPQDSPPLTEELFGPVAPLIPFVDPDEAISIANNTDFGLGASIWTENTSLQQHFIDRMESGTVAVNGIVSSDTRLPFGGIKRSGYGRELSEFGIREFVNIKTVRRFR